MTRSGKVSYLTLTCIQEPPYLMLERLFNVISGRIIELISVFQKLSRQDGIGGNVVQILI